MLRQVQDLTAFLPNYGFNKNDGSSQADGKAVSPDAEATNPSLNPVDAGSTTAGLVGCLITCIVAALLGIALKK